MYGKRTRGPELENNPSFLDLKNVNLTPGN